MTILQNNTNNKIWIILQPENDTFCSYLFDGEQLIKKFSYKTNEHIDFKSNFKTITSPEQNKILFSFNNNEYNVYSIDFDNETGKLSNCKKLWTITNCKFELSPSGKYLYTFERYSEEDKARYKIIRYEIDNQNLNLKNKEEIISGLSSPFSFRGDLMLAQDGNILVGIRRHNKIGCIVNPDKPLPECKYIDNAIDLGEHKLNMLFPNIIRVCPAFKTNAITCNQINFKYCGLKPKSIKYDFGDGTISTETNPTHTYSKSGVYNIKMTTEFDNTFSRIYENSIEIIQAIDTPQIGF